MLYLDDRLPWNPKIAQLSDRAFRLHLSAMCAARHNLTGGQLTLGVLLSLPRVPESQRARDALISELVSAGLWEVSADGWTVHDWDDWQKGDAAGRVRVARHREKMRARLAAQEVRELAAESERERPADQAEEDREVGSDCNAQKALQQALQLPGLDTCNAAGNGKCNGSPRVRAHDPQFPNSQNPIQKPNSETGGVSAGEPHEPPGTPEPSPHPNPPPEEPPAPVVTHSDPAERPPPSEAPQQPPGRALPRGGPVGRRLASLPVSERAAAISEALERLPSDARSTVPPVSLSRATDQHPIFAASPGAKAGMRR